MKKNWLLIKLNKKYFLRVGNKIFCCQIGEGGIKYAVKKVEGDKATPMGKWYLKSIYYRSDKIFRPKLKKKNTLKIKKITKNCGWCDDPNSHYYNKFINTKNLSSENINFEKLWREDQAYDIVVETTYNSKPIIKGKGSAIFIHCSFSDYRKTAGCIALKKQDLSILIKNLSNKTNLEIKNKF